MEAGSRETRAQRKTLRCTRHNTPLTLPTSIPSNACAQVFVMASALKEAPTCTDENILSLEVLISEATKAVDKAVGKGVLHGNTGARRKARMSKYKQELRKEKGLYTA
jgi:hypothetical protein